MLDWLASKNVYVTWEIEGHFKINALNSKTDKKNCDTIASVFKFDI